jgi:DNA repair protein RadC
MANEETNEDLFTKILGDRRAAEAVCSTLSSSVSLPTVERLTRIRGIGRKTAEMILSCVSLSARYIVGTAAREYFQAEDVARRLSFLKYEQKEHFVVMTLDSVNHEIAVHDISIGTAQNTLAHPREVFSKAVMDGAVSIILAHNHPSGSNEPSNEDIGITRTLCAAGRIMEIPVIDHIIVSRTGYSSICKLMPDMIQSYMPQKQKEVI